MHGGSVSEGLVWSQHHQTELSLGKQRIKTLPKKGDSIVKRLSNEVLWTFRTISSEHFILKVAHCNILNVAWIYGIFHDIGHCQSICWKGV